MNSRAAARVLCEKVDMHTHPLLTSDRLYAPAMPGRAKAVIMRTWVFKPAPVQTALSFSVRNSSFCFFMRGQRRAVSRSLPAHGPVLNYSVPVFMCSTIIKQNPDKRKKNFQKCSILGSLCRRLGSFCKWKNIEKPFLARGGRKDEHVFIQGISDQLRRVRK